MIFYELLTGVGIYLQIAEIVSDLRTKEFYVEFEEDEAGKVLRAVFEKDLSDEDCFDAVRMATSRLKITSRFALLEEKTALKQQLDEVKDTNQNEKELVKSLLYLLIKHGKSLQTGDSGALGS